MLIYDHNKEFIGIDQESLELLGYERFEDLIHEHRDVAELFVKKPGYIHNFTNFPWIDFVMHAESDDAKVIIAGKKKAFSANIEIVRLHLSKAPEEDAFLVKLKNIQNYQLDASEQPEPTPPPIDLNVQDFNSPAQPVAAEPAPIPVAEPKIEQPPLEIDEDIFMTEVASTPQEIEIAPSIPVNKEEDEELDIFFHEDEVENDSDLFSPDIERVQEADIEKIVEEEKSAPMLGAYLNEEEQAYLSELKVSDDYTYDPSIAADELGLPVDLIEEFIGDFIKQAHEFKEQLFDAVGSSDFDNIKVLSHKLKGVAANLRIEDSFEVLSNVNETDDIKECEANLKQFYLTVAKLEGKDIEEVRQELEKPADMYDLTPKFETEPVIEEEIFPLDLPDLDEAEAEAEPVMLDSITQETEPAPVVDEAESDLYDFGLVVEESNEPLIVLDDEEEITSDLGNFEVQEEEIISEIQDFEPPVSTETEEAPLLTYDINSAAGAIGLNADLVAALIDDYIVEANEMKAKLSDVIATSDAIRWKGYATQLKGVSDNLRITEISDTLQKLIISTEENQAKAAMQEFYGFINQL